MRKPRRRLFAGAALLAAAWTFAVACNLSAPDTLAPDQAYLTVANPTDPGAATVIYSNVALDGSIIILSLLNPSEYRVVTTIGPHTISYSYQWYAKRSSTAVPPLAAEGGPIQSGPIPIYVPLNGLTFASGFTYR